MAGLAAFAAALAHLIVVVGPLLDGGRVVFVADAEFIRAWRENRP